ncbi:MAG: four helix bundle protein [Opitutus sp.]|nr:four helix bundle protein [Opitutus sp.]
MKAQCDHEKLRAYQEGLRFVAWADPIIERLPGKISARDQLDRASTSIVLNIAEGNGKRSHPDRCRYFDIARGSVVECAACLDVLTVKKKIGIEEASAGKDILLGVVSMVAGLIARFSGNEVREDEQAPYGEAGPNRENEND